MANDPYWNNVVLAMHMDDTGLTDLKGHAITLNEALYQARLKLLCGHWNRRVVTYKPSDHAVENNPRVTLCNEL